MYFYCGSEGTESAYQFCERVSEDWSLVSESEVPEASQVCVASLGWTAMELQASRSLTGHKEPLHIIFTPLKVFFYTV